MEVLQVGNDFEARMNAILKPKTSQELLARQSEIKEELKKSILAGSTAAVVALQAELRDIPAILVASQSFEIRQELNGIADKLQELRSDEEQLLALKKSRNAVVAEEIQQLQAAQIEVQKVELSLAVLDADRSGLRERRRELTAELAKHIEDINNERFN